MRGLRRERLFNKHYNKLIKTKSSDQTFSVNTISSITILAQATYIEDSDLRSSRSFFDKMNLSLHIYLYRGKGDHISELDRVSIINEEDCEWYGVPSQEVLIQWLANKTDLLILHDPEGLPIMRYLCAASNSKLKSTIYKSGMNQEDYDIDLWLDHKQAQYLSLTEHCRQTYNTLSRLGIGPPVIG